MGPECCCSESFVNKQGDTTAFYKGLPTLTSYNKESLPLISCLNLPGKLLQLFLNYESVGNRQEVTLTLQIFKNALESRICLISKCLYSGPANFWNKQTMCFNTLHNEVYFLLVQCPIDFSGQATLLHGSPPEDTGTQAPSVLWLHILLGPQRTLQLAKG